VPACLLAVQPTWASQPNFHLQVVPAIVYKVDDPGGASTSSFVFNIAVICSMDCELNPISARVELSSAGSTVERQDWTTKQLAKIKRVNYRIEPNTPLASPTRAFTLPEAFDVRLYFRHPQALAIDSAAVRLQLQMRRAAGRNRRWGSQFDTTNRRHRSLFLSWQGSYWAGLDNERRPRGGFWNAFAIDLDGLDENYAAQLNDANENTSDAGWGREILAPAAGTVVYARNDVPTNPHPGEEPDFNNCYLPLHDPVMAYAGNCVIIDHGNSEYSVMMHLQPSSVIVKVGNRVATDQVIGRLGNSGDAFGPHLHYQLQSGPQLFQYQSLPFRFQNIDVPQLSRGTYFYAK
jgi:hypothetical protein